VIPEPWDKGMPIVQVKVHVLAEPAKRTCDVEHVWQGSGHRVLDICHQVRQVVVRRAELLEIQAGMAGSEPGGHLS
jgi:hypothetical protein